MDTRLQVVKFYLMIMSEYDAQVIDEAELTSNQAERMNEQARKANMPERWVTLPTRKGG